MACSFREICQASESCLARRNIQTSKIEATTEDDEDVQELQPEDQGEFEEELEEVTLSQGSNEPTFEGGPLAIKAEQPDDDDEMSREINAHDDEVDIHIGYEEVDNEAAKVEANTEVVRPICDLCGKTYQNAKVLRQHIEYKHEKKVPRPQRHLLKTQGHQLFRDTNFDELSCGFCFAKFDTEPDRVAHERGHLGEERPFTCTVCSARFSRRDKLKLHYDAHTGLVLLCSFEGCDKTFNNRHSLYVHESRHGRPDLQWQCSDCAKCFSTEAAISQHLKLVHTELPRIFGCDVCDKK